MDSFALAQDSDQGHSPASSRTSSTYNMAASSLDKQDEIRPPPPLEPIVDIVSPLDNPHPTILPEEVKLVVIYEIFLHICITFF